MRTRSSPFSMWDQHLSVCDMHCWAWWAVGTVAPTSVLQDGKESSKDEMWQPKLEQQDMLNEQKSINRKEKREEKEEKGKMKEKGQEKRKEKAEENKQEEREEKRDEKSSKERHKEMEGFEVKDTLRNASKDEVPSSHREVRVVESPRDDLQEKLPAAHKVNRKAFQAIGLGGCPMRRAYGFPTTRANNEGYANPQKPCQDSYRVPHQKPWFTVLLKKATIVRRA